MCSFNAQLLAVSSGRKNLIAHLVEKVNDTSLEAKGDSRITRIVNSKGHLEERHTLLQIQRSLLCELSGPTPHPMLSMTASDCPSLFWNYRMGHIQELACWQALVYCAAVSGVRDMDKAPPAAARHRRHGRSAAETQLESAR